VRLPLCFEPVAIPVVEPGIRRRLAGPARSRFSISIGVPPRCSAKLSFSVQAIDDSVNVSRNFLAFSVFPGTPGVRGQILRWPLLKVQRLSQSRQVDYLNRGAPMSDRDWNEEKRSVLGRLFNSLFGRRNSSEEEIRRDIHWLGTVNRRLREKAAD